MASKCPPQEMLSDYLENRIPDGKKPMIEKHISDCEICMDTIVIARQVLRDEDANRVESVPREVTEAAVNLVRYPPLSVPLPGRAKVIGRSIGDLLRRLSDVFSPSAWRKLAYAPLRGSRAVIADDLIRVRRDFDGIDVEIEVEKTGKSKADIRVESRTAIANTVSIRVTLKRNEREISSHLLAAAEPALFEDVPFGQYALVFMENRVEKGAYLFQITDTGGG